jgi:hypothetical protein
VSTYAQQKIEGLVLDSDTRQRVGRVLIVNKTSGANTFNNAKGEFALAMKEGDLLIAQRDEYKSDTVQFTDQKIVIFNMKKNAIYIEPVTGSITKKHFAYLILGAISLSDRTVQGSVSIRSIIS